MRILNHYYLTFPTVAEYYVFQSPDAERAEIVNIAQSGAIHFPVGAKVLHYFKEKQE